MQHASPLWRIRGTNAWTIVRQSRLASKLHGVKERGLSLARTARTVKRDVWGTEKIYGNETAKSAAILMKPREDGTGNGLNSSPVYGACASGFWTASA
jgi:hypothetical protein